MQSLVGCLLVENEKIVYSNACSAEIFGRSIDDLIGLQLDQLVHPNDRRLGNERMRQRVAGAPLASPYSIRGLRPDGSVRELETQTRVVTIEGRRLGSDLQMEAQTAHTGGRGRRDRRNLNSGQLLEFAWNVWFDLSRAHARITGPIRVFAPVAATVQRTGIGEQDTPQFTASRIWVMCTPLTGMTPDVIVGSV